MNLWIYWRIFSVSIHTIAVFCFGFALIFQIIYPWGYFWKENDKEWENSTLCRNNSVCPGEYTFGWKFKYLTFWNLIIQFVVFFLCLICDCFPSHYSSPELISEEYIKTLFLIRDTLFHSLSLPIGTFVFFLFFILLSFGRHLLSDNIFYKRNPLFLTHLTHTILVPILWPEAIITYHKKFEYLIELSLLFIIVISYVIWCFYLGIGHNLWPYGLIKYMSWALRIFWTVISFLLFLLIYVLSSIIHSYIWTQRRIDMWTSNENN